MEIIRHYINVNIGQPNNMQFIPAMQGDADTVEIIASIYDKNKKYTIVSEGMYKVYIEGTLASGAMLDIEADSYDEHTVTFTLSKNMLSVNGNIKFCIDFVWENGQKKSTFPTIIHVVRAPINDTKQTSEIKGLLEAIDNAITSAIEAKKSEEKAKEYADDAEDYADEAEGYANDAKEYANDSKKYSEDSKKYSEDSKKSADESTKSANDSKNEADRSEKFAKIAEDKAKEASDSAKDADDYSKLSKSWAVGETGVRTGEDTDNSKYYAGLAKKSADDTKKYGDDIINDINDAAANKLPVFVYDFTTGHLGYNGGAFDFQVNDIGHLLWEVMF